MIYHYCAKTTYLLRGTFSEIVPGLFWDAGCISSSFGTSKLFLTKNSLRSYMIASLWFVMKVYAIPRFPARPVLPVLWIKSLIFLGASKFITILTSSTCKPLLPKSVATRISNFPALNPSTAASLYYCVLPPW